MRKKGFTLIELMVAMGVIAVLIGMSILGIQTVLRSQRDTERRSIASTVQLNAQGFFNTVGRYPLTSEVVYVGTDIAFRQGSNITDRVEVTGSKTPKNGTTDQSGTAYCYVSSNGASYELGVQVESGQWEQFGNSGNECRSANIF